MEKIYFRELIDYANVESGLLKNHFLKSKKEFFDFYKKYNGIGILIPANEKLFDFSRDAIFKIEKKNLLRYIYKHKDLNYEPFKFAFKTEYFLSKFSLKKKYLPMADEIITNNKAVVKKVTQLKNSNKLVGAFQTRNIPHNGHLAIIQLMLKKCNHVVVNPVVGPKLSSDIDLIKYQKNIGDFLNEFFHGKVSILPVYANMFYAGPTEAIHHAILRKNLGFTHFSVGRDHAGSNGIYPEQNAPILAKKYSKDIGIDIITHQGAAFCKKCNKAVVKGFCTHKENSFFKISGSDFRKYLNKKTYYKYANEELQSIIHTEEII